MKLPVPADLKDCPTDGEREVIGFDWQETLEIVPPKLIVRRTGIPQLACTDAPECGVVEADRPVGLIEGNKYDTGVAEENVVDKYGYPIPIDRQQDLFASCGWTPSRGTLLNIHKSAAELLRPLVMHLREVVRAGRGIGTDDTTVTLITPQELPDFDPGDPKAARVREVIAAALEPRRASVTARMWACRSVTEPINLFDFTVSRHREGPEIVLALGRKNSMLIGSIDAGNRAADLMTLASSAVRNDLDVFLYLKDVHEKLLGGRHDFEAMRPDVWKLTHPENANLSPQRAAAPRRGVSRRSEPSAAAAIGRPPPATLLASSHHPADGGKGMAVVGAHDQVT